MFEILPCCSSIRRVISPVFLFHFFFFRPSFRICTVPNARTSKSVGRFFDAETRLDDPRLEESRDSERRSTPDTSPRESSFCVDDGLYIFPDRYILVGPSITVSPFRDSLTRTRAVIFSFVELRAARSASRRFGRGVRQRRERPRNDSTSNGIAGIVSARRTRGFSPSGEKVRHRLTGVQPFGTPAKPSTPV